MPDPTPTDRIFQDVQLNIDFAKEISGATKLGDTILYSNLVESETASSGSNTNNIAVSFAKLYTWAVDIFDFSPSGTNKIMIKPSAIPSSIDTTYAFQEGSAAGAFQVKEGTGAWQTIAVHGVPTIDGNGKILETYIPPVDVLIGATASADGVAGLVPAPLIADKDKFLKGDGTWATPPTAPVATRSTLGGVIVGNGLLVDANGVISIDTSITPVGTIGSTRILLTPVGTSEIGNITELEVDT